MPFARPALEAELNVVPALGERPQDPLEVADVAAVPHHEQDAAECQARHGRGLKRARRGRRPRAAPRGLEVDVEAVTLGGSG
jgi:hypothetical protein